MKKSKMEAKIALNIATQAIKKGFHDIDISWLDVKELLKEMEKAGMMPPKATLKDPLWERYKDVPSEDVPLYVIAGDPWYKANEWEPEDV